ncbi:cation-translocating P-type ATPase [Sphingomonas hylomeconis]|uniref:Cation-translocating P-type ATPase n=1 Tax=Sphingomonas hylomeconis TaxID=1395958 RepID=A0ABV7SZ41_9SPHN|nr:cation-translocating P-type ATPase [Sphingomonas hylomeconis]
MTGLTTAQAQARLTADGANELPRTKRRSPARIAAEVLREPMLALLLGGGLLYLIVGDLTEGLVLFAFASFSTAVTIVQEARTERVLEGLRDLSAPRALVVRDGMRVRIAGRDVVSGDLLVLDQGDRVAADAVLLETEDLQADESLLTGESLPVRKSVAASAALPEAVPGGEDLPFVYSGSMIARGSGVARVIATGARTRLGGIGRLLADLDTEPPRLRRETSAIVRLCAIGGLAIAAIVVIGYGVTRGDWIAALLAGIAIGMSLLPEEFPVVLTVFLAMGAWRIGQVGVLTRRAAAIETLGSATTLCVDKTGTLTENRMALVELWHPEDGARTLRDTAALPAPFQRLLRHAILASATTPVDPMEIALHAAATDLPVEPLTPALLHAYGLRPDLFAMANLWRDAERGLIVTAKGAPEAIAALCRLEGPAAAQMTAAVNAMAARGIRVLGVALAATDDPVPAATQRDYAFSLLGLVGLADPLRPSVPAAIAECRSAGIAVVMITGDHLATARAIATQAGIAPGGILSGPELQALDDDQLRARLAGVTVFARVQPEQKLRIVTALKARGDIVAMTGDGINDAPSLKAAHIGIAMGKRGTDVAREAAAIVLLDDDFASIVAAVRLGRRIYDNIRKAMEFIFAVHVPVAGLALLPLAFGQPLLLGPIHIALIEMIIDPVCALVFEAERAEATIMARPPRARDARLFTWRMIAWSVFQGGLAFAVVATIWFGARALGYPPDAVRTATFYALIAQIVALIFTNRAFDASLIHALWGENRVLRYILVGIAATLGVIIAVPPLRRLLHFAAIDAGAMAAALGSGVVLLCALAALKKLGRQRPRRDRYNPQVRARALRH